MPSKINAVINPIITSINSLKKETNNTSILLNEIAININNNLTNININNSQISRNKNLIGGKFSRFGDTIYGSNKTVLSLGDTVHEGGDIKVYRDGSGNLQLSVDADAASNTTALNVYGGIIAQNYLTVGQTTLNTDKELYINGSVEATSNMICNNTVYTGATGGCNVGSAGLQSRTANAASLPINVRAISDSAAHQTGFQINADDIIIAKATGNGGGGITNKAIGLYGTTPTTQAAHIADPAENVAANNAAIDAILIALENIGITASA